MQISRKEISQELQLMSRILPGHMAELFGPRFGTHPSYQFIKQSAVRLLDSAWIKILAEYRALHQGNSPVRLEPPVNLSDTQLSPDTVRLLSHGPKFAPDLPGSRLDQLASVYQVAASIPEQDRQDFVGSAVRTVCAHPPPPPGKSFVRAAVEELRSSRLKLLESDKSGVFVILDEGHFNEKVGAALGKNFMLLKRRPSGSLRSEAKDLCMSLNLPSLRNAIASPAKQYLTVFFSAKTQKPGIPLRSIVSENGCWQKSLATYLLRSLSSLTLSQPFRVSNSTELITQLETLHDYPTPLAMFSLDIEDMFYSLDNKFLLDSVSNAIHEHGACKFQNSSGISVSGFISLLELYLRSTLVEYEGNVYTQRAGVCIGSCLAPMLSEIFLMYVDRAIRSRLEETAPESRVYRYVDDYLIVHPEQTPPESIIEAFASSPTGLSFKRENPSEGGLQYLDLHLRLRPDGICWEFKQRTQKPILPFASAHSKAVKRGLAKSLLKSSRTRSCPHLAAHSVLLQTERLKRAGYPGDLVENTLKRLITASRAPPAAPVPRKKRFAVIPYSHNTAHRLKGLASRFEVGVVFSCKQKLQQMCRMVNTPPTATQCNKKHGQQFVNCRKEVVYSIPFSCGGEYIGQTGRCLNDRLREHSREVNEPPEDSMHPIVVHRRTCGGCSPGYEGTRVLGGHRQRFGREVAESYAIKSSVTNVSSASLTLSDREISFLHPELGGRDRRP